VTRRIACLFAHPDDDTYGVGGTLALHAGADVRITVVLASSGEAGQIADPSLASRGTLGAVREREDLASWAALGLAPDVRFLRYPDGAIADVPREDLVATFLQVLFDGRPHVVVTFGPDGITGHPDHVAVGEAATEAFHVARAQADGGFERLLHNVLSQGRLEVVNEMLRARGLDPMDPTQPFVPRGVPDATVDVSVDCSAVFDRKVEALRCHRTQGEMEGMPYELWPTVLGREEFRIAWPEHAAGTRPPLTDVFTDLADA
jgi:LmbE family N-acetylglucosaminyl deacetylase